MIPKEGKFWALTTPLNIESEIKQAFKPRNVGLLISVFFIAYGVYCTTASKTVLLELDCQNTLLITPPVKGTL